VNAPEEPEMFTWKGCVCVIPVGVITALTD